MQIREARRILRPFHMQVVETEWNEFKILPQTSNWLSAREAEKLAYCTPSLEDAVNMGRILAAELAIGMDR